MQRLIRILLFLVLLTNTLTLSSRPLFFDVYTVDIALIPFVVTSLLWSFMSRQAPGFKLHRIDLFMVLLFAMMVISLAFSVNRMQSLTGTMDWFRLVAFYFTCRLTVGSLITEGTLAAQFALIGAFLLGLGLIQTITGLPIGLVAHYFGSDRGDFFWHRVSGPPPNSHMFAMWISIFGGFLLAWALARGRTILFFGILILSFFVLIATQSRGGVLGFAMVSMVILWANRSRALSSGFVLGIASLSILVFGLAVASLATSWESPFADGARALLDRQSRVVDFSEGGERRALMETGLDLLAQPKVFMVGCGAHGMIDAAIESGARIAAVHLDRVSNTGGNLRTGVHNVWVSTAVEYGVFSAVVLFAIFWMFTLYVMAWRRDDEGGGEVWTGYLLAIIVWYMVIASQVYLMAARLAILLPIFLLVSLAISGASKLRENRPTEESNPHLDSWQGRGGLGA